MRLLNAVCIISILFSPLVQAKKHHTYSIYSQSLGVTHEFSKNILFVSIDQSKIIKNITKLQKAGLVDANLSATEVGFYQTTLASIVSLGYVAKKIQNIYANKKNDQIQIIAYLLSTDLYGNNTNSFCYSFDFNRTLYQKINWANFQANNLIHIVPQFKASGRCSNLNDTNPQSI